MIKGNLQSGKAQTRTHTLQAFKFLKFEHPLHRGRKGHLASRLSVFVTALSSADALIHVGGNEWKRKATFSFVGVLVPARLAVPPLFCLSA